MRKYSLSPSWRCFLSYPKSELTWVTVIIGAIRVNEYDRPHRKANQQQVRAMLDAFRADWVGMTRSRAVPGMMWRGFYELALVEQIRDRSHHSALFEDLGQDVSALVPDERMLVVHVHLVAVLDGNDPDCLRSTLRDYWPGRWRTQVKGLYDHQTVSEAVTSLWKYSSKNVSSYSRGGLNDEKVKYYKPYDASWSLYVQSLYNSIGREFRSKK